MYRTPIAVVKLQQKVMVTVTEVDVARKESHCHEGQAGAFRRRHLLPANVKNLRVRQQQAPVIIKMQVRKSPNRFAAKLME